jgi:hypothetical protein
MSYIVWDWFVASLDYVEISLFPLAETFISSTVNITFLSFRVRDKFSHKRGVN